MITVHTWVTHDLLWLNVDGHAEHAPDGDPLEAKLVCCSVSTIAVGLWSYLGETGRWDGDRNGRVKLSARIINDSERHAYKFALYALKLVADNYPGFVVFEDGEPCPSTLPQTLSE